MSIDFAPAEAAPLARDTIDRNAAQRRAPLDPGLRGEGASEGQATLARETPVRGERRAGEMERAGSQTGGRYRLRRSSMPRARAAPLAVQATGSSAR